ncbi:MAG: beta strand repeat-containing protein [Luteolibacter sp.]
MPTFSCQCYLTSIHNMKPKHLVSLFLAVCTNSLLAQTYTWNGGTGPWDTTTANWSGAGTIWPTTGTNNEAVFGGTAGTVTIATGGVTANDVTFNTSGYILSGAALTLNGTTPTISIGSGTATFNAALAGSGGFTKSGAGTVRLTVANTISGTANVSGGTLELGAALGSNVTALIVDNATTRLAGTSFNQLDGNSLRVAVTLRNGGVLTADGTTNNAHNLGALTLNGGTLASAGAADTSNGNFLLNNTVTVGGTSLSTISAATVALGGATRTFDVGDAVAGSGTAGTDLLISSSLINGGILKTGAGTLRLTRQTAYSGGTTVNGGTFILDSTAQDKILENENLTINNATVSLVGNKFNTIFNQTNGTITITSGTLSADQSTNNAHNLYLVVLNGGTLASAGISDVFGNFILNNTVTVGGTSLSTISAASIALGGGARTFDVADAVAGAGTDLLVSSAIINTAGGISKTGAGTMVLTAANSYTGATAVNAGTLRINGSTAAGSAVTVAGAAALGGDGTVGGSATFNNSSIFAWNLSVTTPASTVSATVADTLVVNGNLVDGGTGGGSVFKILLAGSQTFADNFWTANQSWANVLTSGNTLALQTLFTSFSYENSSGPITLSPSVGSFSLSGSTLNFTAVPEPSSALAGLLIAAGLLRRRRA